MTRGSTGRGHSLKAGNVRQLKAMRASHSEMARRLRICRTSVRRILAAVWRPNRDTDLARTQTAQLSSKGFSGLLRYIRRLVDAENHLSGEDRFAPHIWREACQCANEIEKKSGREPRALRRFREGHEQRETVSLGLGRRMGRTSRLTTARYPGHNRSVRSFRDTSRSQNASTTLERSAPVPLSSP